MYCSNCGTEIPDNVQYCPNCGASVGAPLIIQAAPQVQAPAPAPTPGAAIQQVQGPPCPRCGNTDPKRSAYSTGLFLFLLCCVGIIFGIIYYILRHDKLKCPQCGKVF